MAALQGEPSRAGLEVASTHLTTVISCNALVVASRRVVHAVSRLIGGRPPWAERLPAVQGVAVMAAEKCVVIGLFEVGGCRVDRHGGIWTVTKL